MSTMKSEFSRLFITPVLPYQSDGEVDLGAYRDLLARFLAPEHIAAGVAVVANPEASEIFYLSESEKRTILEVTLDTVAGRTPVIAGVSHATTRHAATAAAEAAAMGVDGLFVMPPIGMLDVTTAWDADRYPEVFTDMLEDIVRAADLPMVVHPTAAPTPGYGIGLPALATRRIVEEIPNIVGWKMTYNYDGYRRIARLHREAERPVALLGAVAKYFHENLACDELDGTVSGSLNYALEPMLAHIAAWRGGDVVEARRLWTSGLDRLQDYIYSEYSRLHIRYKAATWLRGWIPNPRLRSPLPQPNLDEVSKLRELLEACGLEVISQEAIKRHFS